MLTTYLIFGVLAVGAIGTITLSIFMLMDARAAAKKDDFASRMTKAIDKTANANGLWTRRMRIWAIIFLVGVLCATVVAMYVLQEFRGGSWEW